MATFVVLGIAALAATAITLTRYYHAARKAHAEVHQARGEAEAAAGDVPGAIVELRAALALNRHAPDYVLTLATTLLDANRPREAEPYLDEVIAADPTSGPANRARARAAQALGRPDADRYYQRAYFGAWPLEMQSARLAVGF
jgi:predicted Zn-dependent protease